MYNAYLDSTCLGTYLDKPTHLQRRIDISLIKASLFSVLEKNDKEKHLYSEGGLIHRM
jgi:hypothetical protein